MHSPLPRSVLFVPGNRAERFSKALASAAHLVCIDLEDAVTADSKDYARQALLDFLPQAPVERVAVRINALTSRHGLRDVLTLAEASCRPCLVLIPKVQAAAELAIVAGALIDAHVDFMPLIESAEGLAHAAEIARTPRCAGVMFGAVDFAADLGVPMSWEALLAARAAIVQACVRAGVPAFDAPCINLDDETGLSVEAERVKALGFAGKAAIHPRQVDVINRVFRPTLEEIAEARAALAVYRMSSGDAIQFQGRLLEAPIIRRYERTLADAGEAGIESQLSKGAPTSERRQQ